MNKWTAYVPVILELVLCMGVMVVLVAWRWGSVTVEELREWLA